MEKLFAKALFTDPSALGLSTSILVDRVIFTPQPIGTQIIGTEIINGQSRSRNYVDELSEQGKIRFRCLCAEFEGVAIIELHQISLSISTTEKAPVVLSAIKKKDACGLDDECHEFWSYIVKALTKVT